MNNFELAELLNRELRGKKVINTIKLDDFVVNLVFDSKIGLIFSTHPSTVGLCLTSRLLAVGEEINLLKENLFGHYLSECQKVENEPVFKFVFKGFEERTLVFEGFKRYANIILLGEDENILWALRTFKGEFRRGLPFEKWSLPPSKNVLKDEPPLEKDFSEIYSYLLQKFKNQEKKSLFSRIETLSKKIAVMKSELEEGRNFLKFEILGKTLLGLKDIHRRGEKTVVVTDYLVTPPKEMVLELDPKFSIYENAQKWFKLAKKGKERTKLLPERIEETEKEIDLLKDKIAQIEENDSLDDFIKKEEEKQQKPLTKKKAKNTLLKDVVEIDLPMGFKGYFGKNARGNEVVSFKIANGEDFWFHVADYSGSHLVVRNPNRKEELPFQVEKMALKIAAENSSAPKDNIIEVISSKAKYLARVKGKLGAVYVSKFRKRKIDLNKNE